MTVNYKGEQTVPPRKFNEQNEAANDSAKCQRRASDCSQSANESGSLGHQETASDQRTTHLLVAEVLLQKVKEVVKVRQQSPQGERTDQRRIGEGDTRQPGRVRSAGKERRLLDDAPYASFNLTQVKRYIEPWRVLSRPSAYSPPA